MTLKSEPPHVKGRVGPVVAASKAEPETDFGYSCTQPQKTGSLPAIKGDYPKKKTRPSLAGEGFETHDKLLGPLVTFVKLEWS